MHMACEQGGIMQHFYISAKSFAYDFKIHFFIQFKAHFSCISKQKYVVLFWICVKILLVYCVRITFEKKDFEEYCIQSAVSPGNNPI